MIFAIGRLDCTRLVILHSQRSIMPSDIVIFGLNVDPVIIEMDKKVNTARLTGVKSA